MKIFFGDVSGYFFININDHAEPDDERRVVHSRRSDSLPLFLSLSLSFIIDRVYIYMIL